MEATPTSPRLKQLEGEQLAIFCAALTERMLPNYRLFAEVTEFGDTAVLRLALDKVWDRLTNRCGAVNFETQLEKVDAVTPDPDAFDMYGVYPALDACVALLTTLNQMIEPSYHDARQISQLSLQTIETYLEVVADTELSDEELVRFINTHELIEQERQFQDALIDQLLGQSPSTTLLDRIREQAANDGISNIGIGDD